jgi:hypothetical protein
LGKDVIFVKQFANLCNYFAKTIGKKMQMQNSEEQKIEEKLFLFFFLEKSIYSGCANDSYRCRVSL